MNLKIYVSTLLFVTIFLHTKLLVGQTTIKGKVVDNISGEPLIGATIQILGSSRGESTDIDGLFFIETNEEFPCKLIFKYVGYDSLVYEVNETNGKELNIKLSPKVMEAIVVPGYSDPDPEAPIQMVVFGPVDIVESTGGFYPSMGQLQGVDATQASFGFVILNTRGFNSTSPVRTLQLIDGVDNQSPGLNFSLGNFLGTSELDILSVDLIYGASSAFYGPNAFNGVISMKTKNPFFHKGISALVKVGERNLIETAVRYAATTKNKRNYDVFAFKFNLSYLRANDFPAENYDPVDHSRVPANNPGRFNAVNIYGDEYVAINDASGVGLWQDKGLLTYYRTGYKEKDLVDYNTRNYKANVALHFRTNSDSSYNSPELILSSSFGSGTTVYQGDNRFSLRDILFFQNRLEFRKRDKWFIRAFATNENAGNSYDPYFTAFLLQEEAKATGTWGLNYRTYWKTNFEDKLVPLGYPQLVWNDSLQVNTFDTEAALDWLDEFNDSLTIWHSLTEQATNLQSSDGTQDFLVPGTQRFNEAFNRITSSKSNDKEKGTAFYDKSALYNLQGEYIFETKAIDQITVGGNGRLYRPDSEGTIFSDTAGTKISNWEAGVYVGLSETFYYNKFRINGTIRVDKNQNFNFISSQAASLIWTPNLNHYFRASFSSAIRNPTLSDQFLYLNVGPATLSGNLYGVDSLITRESFDTFSLPGGSRKDLVYFSIDPIRPEKVKTFEIGYRSKLFKKLFVDASYYYSFYNDFIGYQIGIDTKFTDTGNIDLSTLKAYRYSANSSNTVTTQGFTIGLRYDLFDFIQLSGNYSWNKLNTEIDDPIVPAFNTPENKFNLGISGRDLTLAFGKKKISGFGYKVNYKWVEGFLFEGSPQFTGFVPTYSLLDAQVNINVSKINTTFKLGGTNLLDNQQFQTYGGPRIGRLIYFGITYHFVPKES